MKRILLISVILLLCLHSQAQIAVRDTITKKIIFGLHSAGAGYNFKDSLTNETFFYRDIYVEPYVGYFFKKNFGIGVMGGYEKVSSNIKGVNNQEYLEAGAFCRYYYPYKINSRSTALTSMLFLSEISYKFTTYQKNNNNEYERFNRFKCRLLTIVPVGVEFKVWKGLYFELSSEYQVFSNGYNELRYRIGVEYHIH